LIRQLGQLAAMRRSRQLIGLRAQPRLRRTRFAFLAACLFAALLVGSAACGPSRAPENVVHRFFRAVNDKDINRLLQCVDPRQERMYRATFRIIERATGVPLHDLLEVVPGLTQIIGDQITEDIHFSEIGVLSREVSRDTATVRVSVNSTYRSGRESRTQRENMEFVLERFDKAGWRITHVRRTTT
jgi:hypothetical protein